LVWENLSVSGVNDTLQRHYGAENHVVEDQNEPQPLVSHRMLEHKEQCRKMLTDQASLVVLYIICNVYIYNIYIYNVYIYIYYIYVCIYIYMYIGGREGERERERYIYIHNYYTYINIECLRSLQLSPYIYVYAHTTSYVTEVYLSAITSRTLIEKGVANWTKGLQSNSIQDHIFKAWGGAKPATAQPQSSQVEPQSSRVLKLIHNLQEVHKTIEMLRNC